MSKAKKTAKGEMKHSAQDAVKKAITTSLNQPLQHVKIALVCDWLETYSGAERVLEQMLWLFPQAKLFCVVDWLPETERAFLQQHSTTTSFIQHLPFAKKCFRAYLPLMPLAVECLDLSPFDLVISSSHAVAKGVLTSPNQLHICYCHTPMRYAWDLQARYLERLARWKRPLAALLLHWMRLWDASSALRVDHYVANSAYIARRITKVYRREAQVIYPPVNVPSSLPKPSPNQTSLTKNTAQEYVALSRFVPYKKMPLIAQAFANMPQRRLCMIGDGPELKAAKKMAGKNVRFLGRAAQSEVEAQLRISKAMVFAAEEDFGIAPVEAQAFGLPVIAYHQGGVAETVRGLDSSQPTGVFFKHQSVQAICEAVTRFEQNIQRFSAKACHQNAQRFSAQHFQQQFSAFVQTAWQQHAQQTQPAQ